MKLIPKPLSFSLLACGALIASGSGQDLQSQFDRPPDSAKPWVYWYFMDGNMTREGMTADLESWKKAGIGGGIFLEVNIGVPRGNVDFMSPQWQELLKHAANEANRLGLELALGSGPGWCGTGGPWIKPEQSMKHLVSTETNVIGPGHLETVLARPSPRTPYFGQDTLTPALAQQWRDYYQDVAVLAFPTPDGTNRIPDIDEKALFKRDPFSSMAGVKPFLPAPAHYTEGAASQCIDPNKVTNLTARLQSNGQLSWDVPEGKWTIMRFGATTTGQTTRPAPDPGLGFESDKFDPDALDAHFKAFLEHLLKTIDPQTERSAALPLLHFDSWEMGSQNWTARFPAEFKHRRGYDLMSLLPVYAGHVLGNRERSERFLWDVRQTAQELVIENHVQHLKELGAAHGMSLSLEPYDLNPCSDLELGAVADIPQCEFWAQGFGFKTEYSCFEAASIAHTTGKPIVAAESFTAEPGEDWRLYPGVMKNQADWALCCGINRIIFHRFQHQPWLDRFPGMTMGPYGVHWDRTQTWWEYSSAFHQYLSRCQQMLRSGLPVADILYLVPEGAPMVFRPPPSATEGTLPDRKGYNFDGCAPSTLLQRASVKDGRIQFPDGMSYALLVLPNFETMTPGLLGKVRDLAAAGGTILGCPPQKSPSLSNYPECDAQVRKLATELWGTTGEPVHTIGAGHVYLGQSPASTTTQDPFAPVYPAYDETAQVLASLHVVSDFQEKSGAARYIHRHLAQEDLYFVANRTATPTRLDCTFRVSGRQPECWDPVTGDRRPLTDFEGTNGVTRVSLDLAAYGSAFVVFRAPASTQNAVPSSGLTITNTLPIDGPWTVHFDPQWGGPDQVLFPTLQDWTQHSDAGIKYYSGKAVYKTEFSLPATAQTHLYLTLGTVKNIASAKINGHDLGIAWCDPWRLAIPDGVLRPGSNTVEITVANLWRNRLIGDAALPEAQRKTWTTRAPFETKTPLEPSGLLGPVCIYMVR